MRLLEVIRRVVADMPPHAQLTVSVATCSVLLAVAASFNMADKHMLDLTAPGKVVTTTHTTSRNGGPTSRSTAIPPSGGAPAGTATDPTLSPQPSGRSATPSGSAATRSAPAAGPASPTTTRNPTSTRPSPSSPSGSGGPPSTSTTTSTVSGPSSIAPPTTTSDQPTPTQGVP